jgi:3-oxoacyl-[acyl-carrier protein] reductase
MTEKRAALVAGGTGGIGSAVCRALAAAGAFVAIGWHRREEAANALAAELIAAGGSAAPLALDVCDRESVARACASVYERRGRLDILVNCAAVNREAPAAGMEEEAWREVMAANLDGAFALCRAAARYMVVGRYGRIVNVSSIAARMGGRGQINYAASKAGLEAMTRVLALELGRKGVLVNCVAPGIIETHMSERVRREHGDALADAIALRRFGSPAEAAAAIAFLVSDAAGYITGQVLRVDGGMGL